MNLSAHLRNRLACAAVLMAALNLHAEEAISLNFVNADIESVVKAVAHATGRSFLIDPRVKGTVNLVSGKPVQESLALDILASALRLQGFAIVESGGLIKVLPEADAKTQAGASKPRSRSNDNAQLTTRVFQIRNESANQLVPVLRPLIAPNNTIAAYPGNNTLVITDYADNLARLQQIIEAIDINPEGELEAIPVRHASALDVAQTVSKLYGEERAGNPNEPSQRATIVADARSNSILVRLENPGKLARIRNLVAMLDQPTAHAGNIHVVRLKNAEATDLANVLRATLGNSAGGAATSAAASNPPADSGATMAQAANKSGAGLGSGGGASFAASRSSGLAQGSMIQADTTTNSLIITAPDAIYNNLRAVIDQLDRRRAQVHIEALIVELTADKASEFGIQWQGIGAGTGTRLVGGTNFSTGSSNIVGLIENAAKAETSGTLGLSPGLNLGLLTGKYELSALLRALETDSQANILSTPSIVTLDNETAQIVIGQNVPFLTGSYAQTGNGVANPFQTFERRDVGLSLKVRPMITDGGVVKIQIYQEASSLQSASVGNASGPITNKRAIESTVLVDDGTVVVLGGLIDDKYGSGEDKVPLLGDMPLLGSLFRYESRKRTKTNLMIFLRPTILRDAQGAQAITSGPWNSISGAQRKFEESRRSWYGAEAAPQLPATPAGTPIVTMPAPSTATAASTSGPRP